MYLSAMEMKLSPNGWVGGIHHDETRVQQYLKHFIGISSEMHGHEVSVFLTSILHDVIHTKAPVTKFFNRLPYDYA
jgi:hypothetical protein